MRKLLAVVMVFLLGVTVLALVGCGGGDTSTAKTDLKAADAAYKTLEKDLAQLQTSLVTTLGGALSGNYAAVTPAAVQAALTSHEAAGTTDSADDEEAMMVFYGRHVCRLDPWPNCLQRAFARLSADPEVYTTMWGPSECHVTGTLKEWDVRGRLPGIAAPALVLGGRHDECTPAIQEDLHRRLPGSERVAFEQSAHLPHLEEPERFREAAEGFLDRVEGGAA